MHIYQSMFHYASSHCPTIALTYFTYSTLSLYHAMLYYCSIYQSISNSPVFVWPSQSSLSIVSATSFIHSDRRYRYRHVLFYFVSECLSRSISLCAQMCVCVCSSVLDIILSGMWNVYVRSKGYLCCCCWLACMHTNNHSFATCIQVFAQLHHTLLPFIFSNLLYKNWTEFNWTALIMHIHHQHISQLL